MTLRFYRNPSRDTNENSHVQLVQQEQLRADAKREALESLQIAANLGLKIQKAEMQKKSGGDIKYISKKTARKRKRISKKNNIMDI